MKRFYRRLSIFAGVLALLGPVTASAQSPKHDAFIVFGDSLSDTGNVFLATQGQVPPAGTYFERRFSNGPVAVEFLWDLIKARPASATDTVKPFLLTGTIPTIGAVNFAFGGSGSGITDTLPGGFVVPGLLGQIGLFQTALGTRPPPSEALYLIFTGANDYFRVDLNQPPSNFPLIVDGIVDNIVAGVGALYALGARDVVVLNLPNLGLIPLVPDAAKPALLSLTLAHNALLAQELSALALPGLHVIQVDVFSFVERLTARAILTPALPFPTSHCLFTNPATCPDVSTFTVNTRYLFWDAQHPTTATYSAFGHYLHTQLLQQRRRGNQ